MPSCSMFFKLLGFLKTGPPKLVQDKLESHPLDLSGRPRMCRHCGSSLGFINRDPVLRAPGFSRYRIE